MKQYEGLFILNTAGKVEGADEVLAQVTEVINGAGGKVTGEVEKLDNRSFARVANKKYTSGFYAKVPFEIEHTELEGLRNQLTSRNDVFRVLVTSA
ncbi:MAG: 30S ribosomal protein S6 [Verrucomicrobiota bacterium]